MKGGLKWIFLYWIAYGVVSSFLSLAFLMNLDWVVRSMDLSI